MDNSSAPTIAVNVFVAPGDAFRALKTQPKFLLALALLWLFTGISAFLYINGVDIAWLIERSLVQNPSVTEAQAAQFGDAVARLPQAALASIAAVGGVIVATIWLLLQALYFKIFSWITKDGVSYKLWLGIVCFSALPTVLRQLASIANMLVNDISLMPAEMLNPLSIARLLGITPSGRLFEQYVLNLDVMTIWSLGLLVIAHRIIAGKSLGTAVAIVVTPLALMLGLWLVS